MKKFGILYSTLVVFVAAHAGQASAAWYSLMADARVACGSHFYFAAVQAESVREASDKFKQIAPSKLPCGDQIGGVWSPSGWRDFGSREAAVQHSEKSYQKSLTKRNKASPTSFDGRRQLHRLVIP